MLQANRNDINEQGKEKKPANEMNEINEKEKSMLIIQRQLIRIHKFI
jgi:hypothetical protein